MAGGEVKVATVEVESEHNMATLPVSRAHHNESSNSGEKNAGESTNKELELKFVQEKPDKRYFLKQSC